VDGLVDQAANVAPAEEMEEYEDEESKEGK
jgi:hypothetical protein